MATTPPTPPIPPVPGPRDPEGGSADPRAAPETSHPEALDWVAEAGLDPSMAAADWLARDVAPGCQGAISLLADPATPLEVLREAKEAYKAMRVMGELPSDRRTGARLYLGAIAAALASYGARISSQSDQALSDALEGMGRDQEAPPELRELSARALRRLRGERRRPQRRRRAE